MIISHLYQKQNGHWVKQSNEKHSKGVAERCKTFASKFDMGNWGMVMGLLHDKGKEQRTFQEHIKKASGMEPAIRVSGDYHHAYVGALIAQKYYPQAAMLFANSLMGHHRGLYDEGEKKELLKKAIPEDVDEKCLFNIRLAIPPLPFQPKDLHHLERMLYSCLVDADYLDTEGFMQPKAATLRGNHTQLGELLEKLETRLESLKQITPETEVNIIRNYVQQQCRLSSEREKGFYSLTVPTGGGKTLSSVLWALRHAVQNGQDRIIIAIPYTSIIVQTAHILKDILGEENVLEHHSNMNHEGYENETEEQYRIKLATENWDYPVIVTTTVEFFESLFSNKPSRCRKLHNIVNSVVVLDEVQTLPVNYLQPIVDSLDTLKRIFGCSILFTTASLPVLVGNHRGTNYQHVFQGLPDIHEIIPTEANLHEKLRRVKLAVDNAPSSYDDIAKRIAGFDRVLCIVNTRRDAKELYDRLPKEGLCLHLSRMMCPAHVQETLRLLKEYLNNPGQRVIRVIATQLIEAGVDIDFPVVFRQEAGLDSILQAAGRCNREGKQDISPTYVFSLAAEHPLPKGFMTQTNNARLALPPGLDWFAPAAMQQYFEQLFSRSCTFDKADILQLLYKQQMQFKTAAHNFQLIEDNSISVIINWHNSMELVTQLKDKGISYRLLKRLAQYSVNIKTSDFRKLAEAGALEEVVKGVYCVESPSFYHDNTGLTIENQWLEEILIK